MRASSRRSRNSAFRASTRVFHTLFALSLLVSLFAPLVPLTPPAAAAQQGGQFPPPLPAPNRVALAGSFQTALGCPADFDPSCPLTQLEDSDGDGIWTAVLPIPPGDYTFRVVASSDADRSLGRGGDPNGGDIPLSIPGDAVGAYVRYDSLTGEIVGDPVLTVATLVTDLGEQFAMAPNRGGGFEVFWDAQPGNYGFQILFDGEPVAQDSVSLDGPRRVLVGVDPSGAVAAKDTVRDTTLTVSAVDASGAPRTGACFALIDRDDRLRTQACDGDDGQNDGVVELRAPNGLEDANYTLRETFTPEGGAPAEDQRLSLGAGRAEATAQSAGGQAEEPAPEEPAEEPGEEPPAGSEPSEQPVSEPGDQPGRLTVVPVDDAGQPLPNACYAIVEFNFELCDDDGDGTIVFDGVPPGPLTLSETVPPAGFAAVEDLPVTVEPAGNRVRVPHESAQEVPAIQPAETPEAPAEPPPAADGEGQATLDLRDRDGNPVLGACWALTNRDTGEAIQRCDGDDGAEDGTIDFGTIPAGRYRIEEAQTPAGFRPADGQNVEVTAGALAEATVEYRPAEGQPGRLILVVADDDGNPVPETCFDVRGPVELTEVCDRQNDGRLNIPDIPPGEYTVTQTRTAEGFSLAPETTVDVPEGDTIELPLENAPADQAPEPTPEPEETPEPEQTPEGGPQVVPTEDGRVIVTVQGADGAPLPGACVELDDGVAILSVCDDAERDASPQPGQIEIAALAPGAYFLSATPPDGFDAPEPTTVEVAAGQLTPFEIVLTPSEPGTGSVAILAEDDAGARLPAACYTVEIPPGGQTFGPFCDDDGDGAVTIQGIAPGPLAINQTAPPTDMVAADPARQDI